MATRHMHKLDGASRRELLRLGGLGLFGLGLPEMLERRALAANAQAGKAKSCIVLFMLGGPPQHETWDPKPDAPVEVRGELSPIRSSVPGILVGELMPLTARLMDKICAIRACHTDDNAHSTSGYTMSTGQAHTPRGVEGAGPGAPNNWPSMPSVVRHLVPSRSALPNAIVLPEGAANDGNKPWPGQDAGFLGRDADPWLLEGDPSLPGFEVQDLAPPSAISARVPQRLSLLEQLDRRLELADRSSAIQQFDVWRQQAISLIASPATKRAFDLTQESSATRDRYGRNRFGQSVLLARRLIEAGVSLVQVNWTRVLEGSGSMGHWDTHSDNAKELRTKLMPRMDLAYSALLTDLSDRGLLDETLVAWLGEFGRSPKINKAGGRDHWGNVFSVAMAGGGVRGGQVYGESDRLGGEPRSGRVEAADITATVFHTLGLSPDTEIHDQAGRPLPISRGKVIRQIF